MSTTLFQGIHSWNRNASYDFLFFFSFFHNFIHFFSVFFSSAFISLAAKYRHGASNGTPKKRERKDVISNKGPHTTFRRKVKKDDDSIKGGFLKKYYSKAGTYDKLDALDWDAVRISKVDDIAKAIVTRGMSNNLATRIKVFVFGPLCLN